MFNRHTFEPFEVAVLFLFIFFNPSTSNFNLFQILTCKKHLFFTFYSIRVECEELFEKLILNH